MNPCIIQLVFRLIPSALRLTFRHYIFCYLYFISDYNVRLSHPDSEVRRITGSFSPSPSPFRIDKLESSAPRHSAALQPRATPIFSNDSGHSRRRLETDEIVVCAHLRLFSCLCLQKLLEIPCLAWRCPILLSYFSTRYRTTNFALPNGTVDPVHFSRIRVDTIQVGYRPQGTRKRSRSKRCRS